MPYNRIGFSFFSFFFLSMILSSIVFMFYRLLIKVLLDTNTVFSDGFGTN